MATAGSIVIDLLMKTGAFETDSKRAEKRLRDLQKVAKQFGVAVGGAVLTAGTALTAVTIQAIQFADQIDEMSQRLGVSTEQLSGWAYAAKLSGTSFESLTNALPKLSKNMAAAMDEGSRLGQLFKTIGVDVVDAAGNMRDVEDVLPELADRFKALENDTLESALAMELFGRSGAEMLEFLNRGSDGIKDLTDRAAELGIVIGTDTAARAAEFNDRMDDLKAIATAVGLQVADRLLPAMIELVETFSDLSQEGELATGIADGIESSFNVLTSTVTILHAAIKGVTFDLIALYDLADGLQRLSPAGWIRNLADGGGPGESFRNAGVARDMAAGQSDRIDAVFNGTPRAPRIMDIIEPPKSGPARVDESRINAFLADPTGEGSKPKRAGKAKKSEAEMEAERLQQAYESLNASLERQAFFLGKTGEEAQVRYETELGALAELEPALKDQLLAKAALLDAEIAAREEAEKQEELDQRATESFERMNESILEQIELLGMSAAEQEVWNNLAWAGVEADSARGREIAANTELLQELRKQTEDQAEAMDAVRDAGSAFLKDWIDGSKSFEDSFTDALDAIQDRLLQMVTDNLIEQLLGSFGDTGGGSGGDFLGGLFGAFFGGAKAGGGDTIAGRGYLIGEQGPEMFVPRTAGTVIPAEQTAAMLGGGKAPMRAGDTYNILGATSPRAIDRIRMERGRQQRRAQEEYA